MTEDKKYARLRQLVKFSIFDDHFSVDGPILQFVN